MERRDIIKDQIEQLGKVLALMLANFLGWKSKGLIDQGIETSNKQLKSELDIDIEELLSNTKDELEEYFSGRKMTGEHLELLADYLYEVGESKIDFDKRFAENHFIKSIDLLEFADEVANTVSLDRLNKKTKIENMLQHFV